MRQTPSLADRLLACAAQWAAAHDASFARLGRHVVNDTAFFTRLESTRSTTTATLEKFARFLVDAGNWPEGHGVPAEVIAFGHAVGVTAPAAAASTVECGQMDGRLNGQERAA